MDKTIVIVEDDKCVRERLAGLLKKNLPGMNIREVETESSFREEILREMDIAPPAAVILGTGFPYWPDHLKDRPTPRSLGQCLPKDAAIRCWASIRERPNLKQVWVFFNTSKPVGTDAIYQDTFNRYFTKTYSERDLIRAAAGILNHSAETSSLPNSPGAP